MKTTTPKLALLHTLAVAFLLLSTRVGQCYYNPSTGRWLSRDPIEERGGNGLYVFTGNSPQGAIDARGLSIVWAPPVVYTLSQEIGDIAGATKLFILPQTNIYNPAHGCKCDEYKVNVRGKGQVYSWSVAGDAETKRHEKTHIDVHCRRAFDSFRETADFNAGKCMSKGKAACVAAVITKEMVKAYELQSRATGKEWDCTQYGHYPGSRACEQAAILAQVYAAALDELTAALRNCETK